MVSSYSDFRTLDPSKYLDNVSPGRTATIVVAAVDSSLQSKAQADFVCDGVDDHIEIQAALDALPATGGEVKLLDGTYNCEVQIDLDYNQTLRGCGRNTILTTSTVNLIFLSAVGASGSELTGIVIADLQIDGDPGIGTTLTVGELAGATDIHVTDTTGFKIGFPVVIDLHGAFEEHFSISGIAPGAPGIVTIDAPLFNDQGAGETINVESLGDCGIYFDYVDYSFILNVYSRRHATGSYNTGIYLSNSDFNQIVSNTCQENAQGIRLENSSNTTISGNTCQGNLTAGILLASSSNNTISGNTCQGNNIGISLASFSNNNTISGNTCQGNGSGIDLDFSNNNTISGNTCQGNGVGIWLGPSSNNTISGNTCQGNDYGIYLFTSSNNTITGNTCIKNSQDADNTYDNLYLADSSYNLILGNLCRAPTVGTALTAGEPLGETDIQVDDTAGFEVGDGVVIDLGGGLEEYHRISSITDGALGIITIPAPGLTNAQGAGATIDVPEARYGINISDDTCNRNCLIGNDLYDSGKTGDLNDVPFTNPTLKHDNRNLAGTGWLAEV